MELPPNRPTMEIERELEGDLGSRRMIINFGPQHPATHGTLRTLIELDGETVTKMTPEIGYLHSGFEKLAEYRTYNQIVTITDRMNYLSPLSNNVGFALAVEEMMGLKVTPRCAAIRVVLSELSRIADHVLSVGLQAMDLGAFSVMLWTFIEREKLYDIFEAVTGARLTTSYTRVGGLFRDVPPDFEELCRGFMGKCAKTIDEIESVLNENRIFLDRTKGVGAISRADAISYGLSGPLLRSCGVRRDVRKDRPYLGYEQYEFDVITADEGDVYSRYHVRVGEMRQALRIIDQALKKMPSGPVNVDDPRVALPPKDAFNKPQGGMEGLIYHFKNYMFGHGVCPPKGEIYSSTEAPNGELGWYLVSDGTQKPWRMRVRPPSLYNYQAFPRMCEGKLLSDMVAVLSSLNIIAGELDR
ncbi:MAG TPA: NADH dehydrogenase (quinone) subunit D [Planctomycetota bacterium]|nr:NADH dehydrogenase (quinone) subunit D [Planctomycetota bacterium]